MRLRFPLLCALVSAPLAHAPPPVTDTNTPPPVTNTTLPVMFNSSATAAHNGTRRPCPA